MKAQASGIHPNARSDSGRLGPNDLAFVPTRLRGLAGLVSAASRDGGCEAPIDPDIAFLLATELEEIARALEAA